MSYSVRVERVERQPLAVVRRRASRPELSTAVPAACGEVWNLARAHAVERPGRLVAVYLDGAINLEVGVEVGDAFAGAADLSRSETPAGTVAMVAHIGPYSGLAQAHLAIQTWCKANGHALPVINWEVYGHWTDDPAALRTDVVYLLGAATVS